ncbi:MAG: discoidin domain-containing protein [Acidobacteriota bacterium]
MSRCFVAVWILLLIAAVIPVLRAQEFTRGIGVYPGDPEQDSAPELVLDRETYRNLALHRAAYHSSSYDYNLTAQLVTDGIRETKLPRWLATADSVNGVAARIRREFLVDHNAMSSVNLEGPKGWVQFELAGGESPLEIDRIEVDARLRPAGGSGSFGFPQPPRKTAAERILVRWSCVISGSEDGTSWKELGRAEGDVPERKAPAGGDPSFDFRKPTVRPAVSLTPAAHSRFYRIMLVSTGGESWSLSEVAFFDKDRRVEVGGPYNFTSAWMPAGKGTEWVYVDLGAECSFDHITLYWIRRAVEGSIQVSDDAENWRDLLPLPAGPGLTDDIKLAETATGRFVRVLMHRPASSEGYILSELEVYGKGGPVPHPKPAPAIHADGRLNLTGGGWRLQRDSMVASDAEKISMPGFDDAQWVIATVPATVLSSYWNVGALPDPNYGDNQFMISDSFFYADFWYRTEFIAPAAEPGRRTWIHFDGINWKADVYLNGQKLGRIEGAFMRGRFDATGLIRSGQKNALAVRIEKNATPGSVKQKTLETAGLNGGALGADNPTFHASIGWDWIPTVRGRNIGIWNDVSLTTSGPVTLEDPFVTTTLPLPDTSTADVRMEVSLNNHTPLPVSGMLFAKFGDVDVHLPVTIPGGQVSSVELIPSGHPALRIQNPRLWWPNGYGEPNLYDVEFRFETGGETSDRTSFRTGVRQFAYRIVDGALNIWINGRRFVARGGNWGFPETNLQYRKREYDTAVRYHRDMNFTMIRNWVGQTGDDEFYDACDKYGIVVWQDFWLANPYDGPDPDDDAMFLRNVRDTVLRIRNHPSIGIYCGRNEGNPPKLLDDGIRRILTQSHAEIHYFPNSASGEVSGEGPYWVQPSSYYFRFRATPKLHSEIGMPNIPNIETVRRMMPEPALWPPALDWGLHDFNLTSAQRLALFMERIDKGYGGADNAAEFTRLSQFINYRGYRAIFEAQSRYRMGVLLWMSHPCWPSFVWQTYDYDFEPTAGYFGSKKGSEPLHIQWNADTDHIEVVNYSAGDQPGLTAQVELLSIDGSVLWEKTARVDSTEDSVLAPIRMEYPYRLTPVYFLRLKLMRESQVLSENFYWMGTNDGDYEMLRRLPKVTLDVRTDVERQGIHWMLTTKLHNPSKVPALMVRLKVVREKTGDRILPVLYSDNYVALMPDETRTIRTEVEDADTRGETPAMVVEGFNVESNAP